MTKSQQRIGAHGQGIAALALRRVGVEMVEPIGTPVHVIPMGKIHGVPVFRVIYGEKVSGDHNGILPGGRRVLAETKTVLDGNLTWSHLRDHQPARLTENAQHGGLSLLVWVHSSGTFVMRWPVPGFGPRKSITPEAALALAIDDATKEREE